MKVLELLALKYVWIYSSWFSFIEFVLLFRTRMTKVMLTCFKHNTIALSFYKDKLKFSLDETDMNDDITLNLDYEILSRIMPQKK